MTPDELAAKVRAGTATEADQAELYQKMHGLCYKIAKQYSSFLRCPDEVDDLMQEAFFALMEAARAYDPDAGANFLTVSSWYLRRTYENFIGSQTGRSSSVIQKAYAINRFKEKYASEFGCLPADEIICRHFSITPENLQILLYRGKEISLNDAVGDDENIELVELLQSTADVETEVIDKLIAEQVRGTLRRFLDDLPERERRACYMYYIRGWPDRKCAEAFDVSNSRFQQMRQKAVKMLQKSSNLRELGRYLPERIGSAAYKKADRNRWQSSTERAAFMSMHEDLYAEAMYIKHDALREIYGNHNRKENDNARI